MPQIINSFRQTENPLAKVVSTIGNTMFGDTLTPALNRQKLRAAERENIGIEELARTFGGAADGTVSPNAVSELAILAGMKPEDLAAHNVFLTGNKLGPRNAATTNAMAGAGKYKDSAENLDLDRGNAFAMNAADNVQSGANNAANNAQKSWEFLVKPVDAMVNGQPGFVQQGAAAGLGNTGGYADKVVGAESGGDPLAKNPNSTATGAGQFLDSTWLDMMARHAPEFTQGKTPEQILALRNDPTLSRTMTEYFGQENAQTLQSAGLPVTDGTKYLAHFAGAGGATKVLQAPPGTPVSAVLSPEAMAANPFLQGMTTDQLAQWANSKVGGGAAPSIAPIVPNASKPFEAQVQEVLTGIDLLMPGATPEQKRQAAIGKLLKKGGMTVYDPATGNPIMSTGDGPMDLTTANDTEVQGDEIAYRKFGGTIAMAKDLIQKNPNSVGLIGQARGTAQDAATAAQGLAQMFGIADIKGELAQAQKEAMAFGVNPSVLNFEYDPSVSQIESIMNIMAYQGARAIGGQSGPGLSDEDIRHIKDMLGDPTSMFMNQEKLLGKLDLVERYVAGQRAINDKIRGAKRPAQGGATPPPAPGAAPSGTTSKGTGWKVVQ